MPIYCRAAFATARSLSSYLHAVMTYEMVGYFGHNSPWYQSQPFTYALANSFGMYHQRYGFLYACMALRT